MEQQEPEQQHCRLYSQRTTEGCQGKGISSGLVLSGPQGGASQVALVVKNLPAFAGDTRDAGLTPGSGRPLEESMATHSSILAWKTPWTEQPGGSIGSQRVNTTEVTQHTQAHTAPGDLI